MYCDNPYQYYKFLLLKLLFLSIIRISYGRTVLLHTKMSYMNRVHLGWGVEPQSYSPRKLNLSDRCAQTPCTNVNAVEVPLGVWNFAFCPLVNEGPMNMEEQLCATVALKYVT